jgi:hypothetical protein
MYCSMTCQHPVRAGVPQDDGTVLVPLSQGAFAIIDADDADYVLAYNWTLRIQKTRRYAIRALPGGRKNVFLHVDLIGPLPDGVEVDHINGDGLDCRRENMRTATHSQNMHNAAVHRDARSGYKGVSFNPRNGRWVARMRIDGKHRHLGTFDSPEDAAHAYDAVARRVQGVFAWVNFPHNVS